MTGKGKQIRTFLLALLFLGSSVPLHAGMAENGISAQESADNGQEPFSILWITDLQELAIRKTKYQKIGEWCLDKIENGNVVYMFGTGDYVGKYHAKAHWEQFRTMYDPVKEKIPTLMICGNHDIKYGKKQDYSHFLNEIYTDGEDTGTECFYKGGRGKYALFSADGIDFLFLGMSYHYGKNEIDWMEEVLSEYPDRIAVLLFHDYLKSDGTIPSNVKKKVYNRLAVPHENVRLILCGHNHGTQIRTDKEGTREIRTIMYNRQASSKYKGTVMMLTFDPAAGTLNLRAECPLRENVRVYEETFPFDFSKPGQG